MAELADYEKELDSADEEGWHEVTDEEQFSKVKCVFCDNMLHNVGVLWEHCAEGHHFDIRNVKQKFQLDFYGYIKLINFLRKVQPSSKTVLNSVSPYPWDNESFLQPVLPDDLLLHQDIEDSDDEDAYQGNVQNDLKRGEFDEI